ncbi:MAG: APC family permease [Deltaproteobacteria bacterium]|nr:APC family permease [Deltaproteobacteria bacterium]
MGAAIRQGTRTRLRGESLSFAETLGQSIANIGPTLTPALNISVVVALAGLGAWLSYLIATVGLFFVAANIGVLARRHPLAGSYFVYIGRALGPLAGMLAGWSMSAAYLFTAIAVSISAHIFLSDMLRTFGLAKLTPPYVPFEIVFIALIWACAYRDISFSSRIGLALEALSLTIIILIAALVIAKHGSVADSAQLRLRELPAGRVMSALTFAVFSFVGFESSATLAQEARNPMRAIPRAVIWSAAATGFFFVLIAYCMILGVGDQAHLIGDSTSPFAEVTHRAGLGAVAAVVYFSAIISGFACGLASINALARMLFSMGRYEFVHRSMGAVHQHYQTPHLAVTASCLFTIITVLMCAQMTRLNAFSYTAAFGTFGFVLVYLLTCIVAPVELFRAGELSWGKLAAGALGAVMMAFVMIGSLVPAPPYPMSLLPYLFGAYLTLGVLWYGIIAARFPHALSGIELDLET